MLISCPYERGKGKGKREQQDESILTSQQQPYDVSHMNRSSIPDHNRSIDNKNLEIHEEIAKINMAEKNKETLYQQVANITPKLDEKQYSSSRHYSYFEEEEEGSECSEIEVLKLFTDTELSQSFFGKKTESNDHELKEKKKKQNFLYPNIMRTVCIICIIAHHYNEKHGYNQIYDLSAQQWVLWCITALCGTFQVFSKSSLIYRCLILIVIYIFGVTCNFAALGFSTPKSTKDFIYNYSFQMAFIILVLAEYILLHPFKMFLEQRLKLVFMLTYSTLLSIFLLLLAHFYFKEYRYSLYFIMSFTWVTFFSFHYVKLRIGLGIIYFCGYGYVASVYGWPIDSWHGPFGFELYKFQKYCVVYALGFSWGIMMKYHKSLVHIIRNNINLYFLFCIPFFCIDDKSLRQKNLDIISPDEFIPRLVLVIRTMFLMLLYGAIISNPQLDVHEISLGLKIWDVTAFCTHLLWIKFNIFSPFLFTCALVGSVIFFVLISLFIKWLYYRKKVKGTKTID